MLRRITFSVFLVAITVAVSSAPALAKGPEPMTATIRGPWLAHPIIVRGFMGKAPGDPYWRLTSLTFDSLWAVQATAPRLSSLGPRYAVEYMDPCCGHQVHQDLYPYAPGGPWTYTPRGQAQQLFQMDLSAQQGWYHAPTALFSLLSHQGLPPIPASSGLPRLSPRDRRLLAECDHSLARWLASPSEPHADGSSLVA
jgi:hypothetical protein